MIFSLLHALLCGPPVAAARPVCSCNVGNALKCKPKNTLIDISSSCFDNLQHYTVSGKKEARDFSA